MDLIGKWKIKQALSFDPDNGLVWKPVDQIVVSDDDEQMEKLYRESITVFNENGTVETLLPFCKEDYTKEQLDALSQEVCIRDGMIIIGTKEWKNEDGKNLYNTETEGEILGETISPWVEVKEIDGMIELEAIRLERVE